MTSAAHTRSSFTLIELLIVVVIIGLLAAIAIPKFTATKDKAYMASMRGDLRNLATAQESYMAEYAAYYSGTVPSAQLLYNPSPGVEITIAEATTARVVSQSYLACPSGIVRLCHLHWHCLARGSGHQGRRNHLPELNCGKQ